MGLLNRVHHQHSDPDQSAIMFNAAILENRKAYTDSNLGALIIVLPLQQNPYSPTSLAQSSQFHLSRTIFPVPPLQHNLHSATSLAQYSVSSLQHNLHSVTSLAQSSVPPFQNSLHSPTFLAQSLLPISNRHQFIEETNISSGKLYITNNKKKYISIKKKTLQI